MAKPPFRACGSPGLRTAALFNGPVSFERNITRSTGRIFLEQQRGLRSDPHVRYAEPQAGTGDGQTWTGKETHVLKSLHRMPVSLRIDFKIFLLVVKSLNGNSPAYLADMAFRYVPTRSL